jgi:hypothetical protein
MREVEAQYRAVLSELSMTAHSWVPSGELVEDTSNAVQAPGGGGGLWRCGLASAFAGLVMGVLLALLVL